MTGPAAWLDRTKEDPIEPDLPIIDPHHHLWERPGNRYMLDELVADLALDGRPGASFDPGTLGGLVLDPAAFDPRAFFAGRNSPVSG